MRIYLGVTVEAPALLISTAHSSSSSLDETGCVSVSPLAISPADTSTLALYCSGFARVYIHRAQNQLSCQVLNHLFSPEGYFRLPDPEKIMYPWAMEQKKCWHFSTVGTNACLAPGSLSLRHSSSPVILIWLLYPSNSFLPPRAPAALCAAPYGLCQIASLSCR